jgi:predicted nucleic acid-binding protein
LKAVVVPERLAKSAAKVAVGESVSLADAETLLLAKDEKAEFLVDEKVLSDLAKMFGLRVWGTWTLLLESLSRGLIEVADVEGAIDDLGKKRHKLKEKQAAQILDAAKHVAAMRTKRKKGK